MLLKDVNILDFTRIFSGPYATRHFADLGANVIKVEHTSSFDASREFAPIKNNYSGYYELLNRNKKSVSLNLKNKKELDLIYKLVKEVDVVVENFTPDIKYKLKIDYKTFKKINKNIIYVSISGISDKCNRKYFDVIAQAESGLASLVGKSKESIKIPTSIVDAFTGIKAAFAISTALYYKEKYNKGQNIHISMLGSALDLLENNFIEYSVYKKDIKKPGNLDTAIAPFGFYKTKDGEIALAVGSKNIWNKFKKLISENTKYKAELFENNNKRLLHNQLLTKIIEEEFCKYSTDNLLKRLNHNNIPSGKINNIQDVYNNKQLYKLGFLSKTINKKLGEIVVSTGGIKFSKQKSINNKNAPNLGENNKEYGIEEI